MITSGPIAFRALKSGGFQLLEDWWCDTGITDSAARIDGFVSLDQRGQLTVRKGYQWDGASGPAINTKSILPGSLAHDALYQLLRAGKLPQSLRSAADDVMVRLCEASGMSWIRCKWVRLALRLFAGFAAKVQPEVESVRLRAP